MTETSPLGQFMSKQAFARTWDELLPAGQFIYSSVNVVASVFDAILPSAQVVCVHVVIYPLLEKKSKAHVYIHLFFVASYFCLYILV
jgi:mannose/fructose/N-acetylgalactosamine-specific phosphotransferase system component IID